MTDIPPPSQSTALIGHDQATAAIHAAFDAGRMPHAWLLTGPGGIGKATLAYHMAHLLLSNGEMRIGKINPGHPAARLIMAESHPDMFVLRRPADEKTGALKETIPVESARQIVPFFRLTPALGKGRVALIDEAHTLGRFGQNAILKMIEEPPTGGVIIMTATSVGTLLPTIRSRCRVLPLAPLPPGPLEVVLNRLSVDLPTGTDKELLMRYAAGSAGRAIQILQTESLPLLSRLIALVTASSLDMAALHQLADQIGKKADVESFDVLTSLFLTLLRDAIRNAAAGQGDPTGLLPCLIPSGDLSRALDLWEETRTAFAAAKTANLDNKLAFINAITTLVR